VGNAILAVETGGNQPLFALVREMSTAKLMQPARLRKILAAIQADPRYQRNILYGEPRSGHPEGSVGAHIEDLEANLERLRPRLKRASDHWKLKLLIHLHDTFKAEAEPDVAIRHPRSHASLASVYARAHLLDEDLVNMIQFHDVNYALWLQYTKRKTYDHRVFQRLLDTIQDWDLFLTFLIIDGCTEGKDPAKLGWFINEVRKHKQTRVDESWILPVE
jgi:hypothetical protein